MKTVSVSLKKNSDLLVNIDYIKSIKVNYLSFKQIKHTILSEIFDKIKN